MAQQKAVMGPCPKCNSKDNLATYPNHTFCFGCKTFTVLEQETQTETKVVPMNSHIKHTFKTANIPDRKITADTCKKYGVTVALDGLVVTQHKYNYYDKDGNHVASKYRNTKMKDFWSEGPLDECGLFGQNVFNQSGKYITVCEGELDAMSVFQLTGSKYPSVSIKNGAASALKNCKQID